MVTLINTNPLGEIELPLVGRVLAAGEEFDVSPADAETLLAQAGNFRLASPPDDLGSLTIKQLEAIADDQGIDLTGITKKADIITALTTADNEKG